MTVRFSVLLVLLCIQVPVFAQSTLPEGEGRDIVEDVCNTCHGLNNITDSRRSKAQWQRVVSQMLIMGAPLADYEVDTVVDYLAKNFGSETKPSADK